MLLGRPCINGETNIRKTWYFTGNAGNWNNQSLSNCNADCKVHLSEHILGFGLCLSTTTIS